MILQELDEFVGSISDILTNTARPGKGTVLYPGYNIMVNGYNIMVKGYNIRGT